jgi:hypothetical protein
MTDYKQKLPGSNPDNVRLAIHAPNKPHARALLGVRRCLKIIGGVNHLPALETTLQWNGKSLSDDARALFITVYEHEDIEEHIRVDYDPVTHRFDWVAFDGIGQEDDSHSSPSARHAAVGIVRYVVSCALEDSRRYLKGKKLGDRIDD